MSTSATDVNVVSSTNLFNSSSSTLNTNQTATNASTQNQDVLKSVYQNIKVTDPAKVTAAEYLPAEQRYLALGPSFNVVAGGDWKSLAIYFRGNDTDDARHVVQVLHIELLQQALIGYRGIHGSFPSALTAVDTEWPAIQAYCLVHQSTCNGGTMRLLAAPILVDVYTNRTYVYATTADNFTVRYFLSGCGSQTYCHNDNQVFVVGTNTMSKDQLSLEKPITR